MPLKRTQIPDFAYNTTLTGPISGAVRGFEQIRGDYRAVRARDENEPAPAVGFDDSLDFTDHGILLEYRVGYTRAHRHNLKCDYSDLCIISTTVYKSRRKLVYG
jgi:hypothetical protein